MFRDQLRVVQGDKGLVYFYDKHDPGGLCGSEGVYCKFKSETNVLYPPWSSSISGPRDETERERVGACVIPKADSKF